MATSHTTSTNPKVLNRVLKYKLQPVLDKIAILEKTQEHENTFIESIEAEINDVRDQVQAGSAEFTSSKIELDNAVDKANNDIAKIIRNSLYNPNVATLSEEETNVTIIESNNIIDKIINDCVYGLVIDNIDYMALGFSNKGLSIIKTDHEVSDIANLEVEFMNPSKNTKDFPSYYINDILKIDNYNLLIATNIGVVKYNIITGKYITEDLSFGLPSLIVHRLTKVQTSDGSITGYFAATEKGCAYSSDGEIWRVIDRSFISPCTRISSNNYIDKAQTVVFIGSSSGLFYVNMDEYLGNDSTVNQLKSINGLTQTLPSKYINSLSYNDSEESNGELAIGTNSGLVIIRDVKELLEDDSITVSLSSKSSRGNNFYTLYNTSSGLNSASCSDVLYLPNGKLVIATNNGINIADSSFTAFTHINKIVNTENENGGLLSQYNCVRICRKSDNELTILHGTGLTENIVI